MILLDIETSGMNGMELARKLRSDNAMLRARLDESNAESTAKDKDCAWRRHNQLKRGEPAATFKGMIFSPEKL